ncbi:nucleotidyltransferase domain-containing protein [Lentibacillus sp. N15]|uniref:nucleotidyltransferase domain-containing protein n=1 Tax=Lentibacillus songyuanensis TaxID=3136161 RepID=UPI0031BAF36C
MFGLRKSDQELIKQAIGKYNEVKRAVVFGSRAMGNYKKGSDIDIAVMGEGITRSMISDLNFSLNEESHLPYFFDVVHYERITNKELIAHIDMEGIEMYSVKSL